MSTPSDGPDYKAAFEAAMRWIAADIHDQIFTASFDFGAAAKHGYLGEYLNDLATMRSAARHLSSSGSGE